MPARYYREEYRVDFVELYADWRQKKAATEPEFVIENIRFDHDPNWRNKFFSIQSAHDHNHWVWKVTAVVWAGIGAPAI